MAAAAARGRVVLSRGQFVLQTAAAEANGPCRKLLRPIGSSRRIKICERGGDVANSPSSPLVHAIYSCPQGQFWPAAETVYESFMFVNFSAPNTDRFHMPRFSSTTNPHDRFFEDGTGRYSTMGHARKPAYLAPKRPSRRRHGDLWGRVRPRAVEDETRPLVEG